MDQNSISIPKRLLGVPGSGKTRYLIKCVEKYPNINFLVISFSNFTVNDIASKFEIPVSVPDKSSTWPLVSRYLNMSGYQSEYNSSNYKVKQSSNKGHKKAQKYFPHISTIHKIALKLISGIYYNMKLDYKEILNFVLSQHEFWEFSSFWNYLSKIDWIIVDEAQDISEVQFMIIYYLAIKVGANYTLAGDPNQTIYKFQGANEYFLLYRNNYPVFNTNYESCYPSEILRINYRSRFEINDLVRRLARIKDIYNSGHDNLEADTITNNDISKNVEIPVKFLFYRDKHSLIPKLAKIIESWRRKLNPSQYCEIAVLCPSRNPCPVNGSVKEIYKGLNNLGIPCQIQGTDDNEIHDGKLYNNKVQLLTIHACKGLEFEKVIVVGYCDKFLPYCDNDGRDLFYVGFSRAEKELVVLIPDNEDRSFHCSMFDIFNIDIYNYKIVSKSDCYNIQNNGFRIRFKSNRKIYKIPRKKSILDLDLIPELLPSEFESFNCVIYGTNLKVIMVTEQSFPKTYPNDYDDEIKTFVQDVIIRFILGSKLPSAYKNLFVKYMNIINNHKINDLESKYQIIWNILRNYLNFGKNLRRPWNHLDNDSNTYRDFIESLIKKFHNIIYLFSSIFKCQSNKEYTDPVIKLLTEVSIFDYLMQYEYHHKSFMDLKNYVKKEFVNITKNQYQLFNCLDTKSYQHDLQNRNNYLDQYKVHGTQHIICGDVHDTYNGFNYSVSKIYNTTVSRVLLKQIFLIIINVINGYVYKYIPEFTIITSGNNELTLCKFKIQYECSSKKLLKTFAKIIKKIIEVNRLDIGDKYYSINSIASLTE